MIHEISVHKKNRCLCSCITWFEDEVIDKWKSHLADKGKILAWVKFGDPANGVYLPDDHPDYVTEHYCTLFIEPKKDQFAGIISLPDVYMPINESLFQNKIQFIFDKLNSGIASILKLLGSCATSIPQSSSK